MFLEILAKALAEHPEFSSSVATEMATAIWRRLSINDNTHVQKRLSEVLAALNIPNRLRIEELALTRFCFGPSLMRSF